MADDENQQPNGTPVPPPEELTAPPQEPQGGQSVVPTIPPPGLEPEETLNAIDESLSSINANKDIVNSQNFNSNTQTQSQASAGRNADNVELNMENANNEAPQDGNADNVERDRTWRLNHAKMLKAINDTIQKETVDVNEQERGEAQRKRHEFMAFDVASPSAEEARWIVEYAKDKGMQSVDQTFVNQALAAMRSTHKVDINNLPAPNQTEFREADQQILIKALYNSGSPRDLEEVKFEINTVKDGEREQESGHFKTLKTLMADLHVNPNEVMDMLLQANATPSRSDHNRSLPPQTVVHKPDTEEAPPRVVDLSSPSLPVTDAIRKKLDFQKESNKGESKGQRPRERISPETQKSQWRIATMHELEALEIQLNFQAAKVGKNHPGYIALFNRRNDLISQLYPKEIQVETKETLTQEQNEFPVQEAESRQKTDFTQSQKQSQVIIDQGVENQNLIPPPTINVQPSGYMQTAQLHQANVNRDAYQWYNPWSTILPPASSVSVNAGSTTTGPIGSMQNWGHALVPRGQTAGWQPPPSQYGTYTSAPPGGGGWQPPPGQNLQLEQTLAPQINQPVVQPTPSEVQIMSKLKLPTFRGKHDRTTPYEYMRIIRTAAKAHYISLNAMLDGKIPTLMIQEAANWFAVNRPYFTSWEEFHRLFMEEYCCPNYREKLLSDLEQRRQDPTESGTVFLHKITLLCREIDENVPDYFIIAKAAKQLHPEYKARLFPVLSAYPSLMHFEMHIRQIQGDLYESKMYKPPPPAHEFAEPAFAFEDHKPEYRVTFNTQQVQQTQGSAQSAVVQAPVATTAVSLSSLNPQITRQRAIDAHVKSTQQKNQGAYKKTNNQTVVENERSRSPFRSFGPSGSNNNNPRGYSPGGKNWTSPGGTRWARSLSPHTSGSNTDNKTKFSNYQSPSRPADAQTKGSLSQGSQSQDQRRQSPHRPASPSKFHAKAASAEEEKNS
jgi:hypothetical protein